MLRHIKAVLFDLDGTLIDSAPDLAAAADRLRLDRGLPELGLTLYRPHTGTGARGMLKTAFYHHAPPTAGFAPAPRTTITNPCGSARLAQVIQIVLFGL